jgi:hypothetical protein
LSPPTRRLNIKSYNWLDMWMYHTRHNFTTLEDQHNMFRRRTYITWKSVCTIDLQIIELKGFQGLMVIFYVTCGGIQNYIYIIFSNFWLFGNDTIIKVYLSFIHIYRYNIQLKCYSHGKSYASLLYILSHSKCREKALNRVYCMVVCIGCIRMGERAV